jgi:hypothetical protein
MAHVDFKITTWERVSVPDDQLESIIEQIKSGEITNSSDLICECEDATFEGTIDDTQEQMTPSENDGQCTIDVFNDSGDSIFNNEPQAE